MGGLRRRPGLLVISLLAVGALVLTSCGGGGKKGQPTGPIKIGLITSLTGPGGIYGEPVKTSAQLAVNEVNASGGVDGRKLQLVVADDATDPATGQEVAQRLITRDKIDALVSMTNSGVRDAYTPVVQRAGIPFVYVTLYEGGACLPNLFSIGEVPPQYAPTYGVVQQEVGANTWYFVGHDYVWPQKTLPQARQAIEAAGGKVLGQDLVPFGTSDFADILGKIKSSGAKIVHVLLVGPDFAAFLKQWRSFGLDQTTTMYTLTLTDDFLASLGAEADGLYASFGYFQDLNTSRNQQFLADYRKAFGAKAAVQTTLSEATYDAIRVYALAANKARSTDSQPVNEALAGISYADAPRGSITIDAKTHHVTQTMYLLKAQGGRYSLVKEFPSVPPGPQCTF
jgi:urea transport system substrate-binding protein